MKTSASALAALLTFLTLGVSGGGSEATEPLPTPYFSSVTGDTGLTGVIGYRISVADVNGDGYPDLLLHTPASEITGDVVDKQFLYLNLKGDDPSNPRSRKFVDFTAESGIRTNRRGTNDGRHSSFAVFADVDNDGDLDLFSGVYSHDLTVYPDRGDRNDLFLNDGMGHFTLAPSSIFHTESLMNTASGVFLDYDLDGNIDLFIGNWLEAIHSPNIIQDQLYRGHGDGRFTNVTAITGIAGGLQPTYAVTEADWNNDGFVDLLPGNYCRDHSIHWKNNGDGTFSQVQDVTNYGLHIGPGDGTCSFGSMPRDFDNDGDIDIFELIVHGAEGGVHSTVLVNENNVYTWDFNKITRSDDPFPEHHRDHYGSWFDVDNDGLADFVLAKCCDPGNTGNRLTLFKQSTDHNFHIVTSEAGLSSVNASNLRVHNVIPLDYDRDGDEDLLIGFASGQDGVQLWRNDVGSLNNWITLSLEGAGGPGLSNRSAIGARVEVTAGGRTYSREVYAGNGQFGPQTPLSLTFGLGPATTVDTIKVHWPNREPYVCGISRCCCKSIHHSS